MNICLRKTFYSSFITLKCLNKANIWGTTPYKTYKTNVKREMGDKKGNQ